MAWGLRLWRGAEAEHWVRHTVADELARIDDPVLRAVLGGPLAVRCGWRLTSSTS
jgi:hypothetical protein